MSKKIGLVQVTVPFDHHNASFETAAWWEGSKAIPGIYPIEVETIRGELRCFARISHQVVASYFPSLYDGTIISNRNRDANVGQLRTIDLPIDLSDAILKTGTIPSTVSNNYFVEKEYTREYVLDLRKQLFDIVSRISNDVEIHMLAYYGGLMAKYGRAIDDIERIFELDESDYWRKLHEKNSAWVRQ